MSLSGGPVGDYSERGKPNTRLPHKCYCEILKFSGNERKGGIVVHMRKSIKENQSMRCSLGLNQP